MDQKGGPYVSRRMPRWFAANRNASEKIVEALNETRYAGAVLYHYTDVSALQSIITKGEFWLHDATFMNDRTEIEHGVDLAIEALRNAKSDASNDDLSDFLQIVLSHFRSRKRPSSFVCCFSLNGDDLNQWSGYGRLGKGVAIALESGPLMFGYSSESLLMPVYYSSNDKRFVLQSIISSFLSALREDLRNPIPDVPTNTPTEEVSNCADSLYHALWRYIIAFKDDAFSSEKEIRFVYLAHDFAAMGMDYAPKHAKPLFRAKGNIIVPYLTSRMLDFGSLKWPTNREHPPLPILKIVVGPRTEAELLGRGLRQLLDVYGHAKAEIIYSAIPFRE